MVGRLVTIAGVIAVNMLPLVGVLFLGWPIGDVLLYFWAETCVLLIVWLIVSVVILHPRHWLSLVAMAFFITWFTAGHFVFVAAFNTPQLASDPNASPLLRQYLDPARPDSGEGSMTEEEIDRAFGQMLSLTLRRISPWWLAVMAIAYMTISVRAAAQAWEHWPLDPLQVPPALQPPWGRTITMHLGLIFGTLAAVAVGWWGLVAVLIGIKLCVEAGLRA